jgi:hypothetical protein
VRTKLLTRLHIQLWHQTTNATASRFYTPSFQVHHTTQPAMVCPTLHTADLSTHSFRCCHCHPSPGLLLLLLLP